MKLQFRNVRWVMIMLLLISACELSVDYAADDSRVDVGNNNKAPSISSITTQQIIVAKTNKIPFIVDDEFPDSLIFTLASNNQDLVQDSKMKVLGSGTKRELEITPEGVTGTLGISLSVEDNEGFKSARSFPMTVVEALESDEDDDRGQTPSDPPVDENPGEAETIQELKKLAPDSDDALAEDFGSAVATFGDYAIVNKYTFKREGNDWVKIGELNVRTASETITLVRAVDMLDDYAIVGTTIKDTAGATTTENVAYIFKRDGDEWLDIKKLIPSDTLESRATFAYSVALSSEHVVIGNYNSDVTPVYVFKQDGDDWIEVDKLNASDPENASEFGSNVAVFGEYILIGASHGGDSGAAYIFKRSGDEWVETQILRPSDNPGQVWFGHSVSLSDNYAIIGAQYDDSAAQDAGAVYVFKRNEEEWTEVQKLSPNDASTFDRFGFTIDILGDYFVVGAPIGDSKDASFTGAAYVYEKQSDNWIERRKLNASDAGVGDLLGLSVSLSDDYIIVGAPVDGINDRFEAPGSAYIFQK